MSTEPAANIVRTEDYLGRFPDKGRFFELKEYGLKFFMVKDCFCSGPSGQIIAPINDRLDQSAILDESFNYDHDENAVATAMQLALQEGLATVTLDEAAPLFPIWGLHNFWHWLFNCLPKVLLLESLGFKGQYIVNRNNDYTLGTLALAGIDDSRVLHCDRKFVIRNLFTISRINGGQLNDAPRIAGLVRNAMLEGTGRLGGGKRCYVKRIGTRKVEAESEAELLEMLRRYDFEILVPEEHSIAEQIRFMSNSICTLGPHGANTALTLFQKERGVMMEFFGLKYVNYCNSSIAKLLKLLYIPVTQDMSAGPRVYAVLPNTKHEDFPVDVKLVDMLLGNLKDARYGI